MTTLFDFELPASEHLCRECGSAIIKKPGPGRFPVYCNDECRHAEALRRLVQRERGPNSRAAGALRKRLHEAGDHSICRHDTCWICRKPMISHGAERPTCSWCRREHGSGVCSQCGSPKWSDKPGLCRACKPARPKAQPGNCKLCGEFYVPRKAARPDQSFCSKGCKTAWQNGARPPYQKADRAGRRVANARARRLRHAQTWDGITDEEILERDGWRCQIPGCKRRPIRKDLKYPHLRSKSVDHIIPLSLGGDDTAENKRAAHFGCNMARGNQMTGTEQVALFGVIREAPLVTRTANGVTVRPKPPPPACKCGNQKRRGHLWCDACWKQLKADRDERRQAAAQERQVATEKTAALHAEIRKLRAQGYTTRATAELLGTSSRMVVRVDHADPVTGKLPR